jgi:hypothetical protein
MGFSSVSTAEQDVAAAPSVAGGDSLITAMCNTYQVQQAISQYCSSSPSGRSYIEQIANECRRSLPNCYQVVPVIPVVPVYTPRVCWNGFQWVYC